MLRRALHPPLPGLTWRASVDRQTTGAGAGTLAQPLGMLFNALNTATNSNTLQTAVMVFLTVR